MIETREVVWGILEKDPSRNFHQRLNAYDMLVALLLVAVVSNGCESTVHVVVAEWSAELCDQ